MIIPTVHLNGTSKDELVRQLCDASAALANTLEMLQRAAPNGRDYYPQGGNALKTATAEHCARLEKIDSVKKEIDELAFEIDQQN